MRMLFYIFIYLYIDIVQCDKSKEISKEIDTDEDESEYDDSEEDEEFSICAGKYDKYEGRKRCNLTAINHPYSASIQRKGIHFATGALIDKKWIITLASEFYNVRESIKWLRARLGSVNCKKGGTLVAISSIVIHPQYEYGKSAYDLALLKLAVPVKVSKNVKPVGLSKVKSKILEANFLVTYWPRLVVKGEALHETAKERTKGKNMRVSTQKLIPWDNCYDILHKQGVSLDKNSFCLKPIVSHHSPCMPDVGGPVVAEDGLWGITSGWISKNCLKNPSPTVVTRVSAPLVRSWLHKQLYYH